MSTMVICTLYTLSLFGGVLACLHLGWRLGRRRFVEMGDAGHAGLGALEGAIYGLMGLILAFSFSGAAARFQMRAELITQQVNAIGTAWQRLDLLLPAERAAVQADFRSYVDTVITIGQSASEPAEMAAHLSRLGNLQDQIWAKTLTATRMDPANSPPMLLLPALNQMFDSMSTRLLTSRQHPPIAIYWMLCLLVLVSALMAGFGMAKVTRQSWLHLIGYSAVIALAVYLILDLEFPRLGFIRIDRYDQALTELRASMK